MTTNGRHDCVTTLKNKEIRCHYDIKECNRIGIMSSQNYLKEKCFIYATIVFSVGHKSHFMDLEYIKEIEYLVKTIGTIISMC